MIGKELFQIVSTGTTLHEKPAAEVVATAAKLLKVPTSQAQRLLLKGWVIKDQLSRAKVVEYRARLEQIGLKIAVYPAGKFDNRALLARLNATGRKSPRGNAGPAGESTTEGAVKLAQTVKLDPHSNLPGGQQQRSTSERQALEQLQALFADTELPGQSFASSLRILPGAMAAAIVPGAFLLLAILLFSLVINIAWELSASLLASGAIAAGSIGAAAVALLAIALVAGLTVVPFFRVKNCVSSASGQSTAEEARRPLNRQDAPQLFLLLEALSSRACLPEVDRILVSRGAGITGSAVLGDVWRQRTTLLVGLSAVRACSGRELIALLARAMSFYSGRGWGLVSYLVFGTAQRLRALESTFEGGRVLDVADRSSPVFAGLDKLLGHGAKPLAAMVSRMLTLHRRLAAGAADLLQKRADRQMAIIIGSDGFSQFTEKWWQLDHSAQIAAEANRGACLVNQRLADFPAGVAWLMGHLDAQTRESLELAMTHRADPWALSAPADINRIAEVEFLSVKPMMRGNFSTEKLFRNLSALSAELSSGEGLGAQPVGHRQLLAATREMEEAMPVLREYFNRIVPLRMLSMGSPVSGSLAALDLQGCIDWLRGELLELGETQARLAELENRAARMQLGRMLLKAKLPVDAQEYLLSGATVSAADKTLRDNEARLDNLQQQVRAVHSVFALRIKAACKSMPRDMATVVNRHIKTLGEFETLASRLENIDSYVALLAQARQRLPGISRAAHPVAERLVDLARGEWMGLLADLNRCPRLAQGGVINQLQKRVGSIAEGKLPRAAKAQEVMLRQLQTQLKVASAEFLAQYRVVLAKVLGPCLEVERARGVRPLRLLAVSA
ncbi:hypothetical protein Maes01_01067 [Microbulbifer aestuariivivens]|uniref:Uncharacterized protein n=1 Tax=Microbulbifer aestuariivivens TaxID=1908308 RepID=A0ABP9WMR2_9GAMM